MADRIARQVADRIRCLAELAEEARQCTPLAKADAITRKWIAATDLDGASEFRMMCATVDATTMACELLMAQPSANGSTSFDRLAQRPTRRTAQQATALAALRASRFALLTITGDLPGGETEARDHFTGQAVRLACDNVPPGLAGTSVFGRLASLGDGLSVIVGVPTPLDTAALAVATGHVAARLSGAGAGARWADAIYTHVVRHGTLDIPGVNRPRDMDAFHNDEADEGDLGKAEGDELVILARAWAALGGKPPGADLLQRSRQLCDPNAIASAVIGMVTMPAHGQAALAAGFERLALVQVETVLRREQMNSGTVTLDCIANHLDGLVTQIGLPSQVREAFRDLRQRVTGKAAQGSMEDAELSRLLQRIRGLRAKTVDQGCTEQEALAAAEKVAELLDRYGLSLGELDFRAQPCDGAGVQTTRKRMAPLDHCVPAIAAFFDCRVWAEHPGGGPMNYVFFGLRADVAAAQYLYELVDRAFETETNLFRAGPVYESMTGERRGATTSFQTGLAAGICDKLQTIRAARAQRQSSGRDLVVMKAAIVDEEIAKLGLLLHVKTVGSASKRVLEDAFVAGQEAAERFDYTPGICQAA